MRLLFDGTTPLPRLLLLSTFLVSPDFEAVLNPPAFLPAGHRVTYHPTHLTVSSPTGTRHAVPIADSYWLCHRRPPAGNSTATDRR
ncbi:hypothetical protein [Kitasatospora cineracea]|uniref:Uncharacterized protein n=1 Tax=Kitasatospora cineracea TaxID=88074 RepID=A0A3N4RV57_9ACTN|nr:hypothetical protein [Kitasatospora cineracea]RPE36796.1 hypothetical protein EDD38_5177 [Kitasatospora cineracea]